MTGQLEIRESKPQDRATIDALYRAAFPEEDLLPLLTELLKDGPDVLSLVALTEDQLAGHVIFTPCGIDHRPGTASLLGPLAVAPNRQRQGVGGELVRAGLQRLEADGTELVCALGDPGYYGRFGFAREAAVLPPYKLPKEWDGAWQSLCLKEGVPPVGGTLKVPEPWQKQTLWSP
ncbi:MAG: N-acetyltransferase [Pseudomonadota bacterium]